MEKINMQTVLAGDDDEVSRGKAMEQSHISRC